MWIAALNGHLDCLRALRELGADPDQAADNGCTSAYVAAEYGHAGCVSLLGELGADLDRADRSGMTPAFIAALNGHAAVLRCLGEARAQRRGPGRAAPHHPHPFLPQPPPCSIGLPSSV